MINEDHLPKKIKSLDDLAVAGRRWARITNPNVQLKGGGFVSARDNARQLAIWHMTSISHNRVAWRMIYGYGGVKITPRDHYLNSRVHAGQDDSGFLVSEGWYVLYDKCVFA